MKAETTRLQAKPVRTDATTNSAAPSNSRLLQKLRERDKPLLATPDAHGPG